MWLPKPRWNAPPSADRPGVAPALWRAAAAKFQRACRPLVASVPAGPYSIAAFGLHPFHPAGQGAILQPALLKKNNRLQGTREMSAPRTLFDKIWDSHVAIGRAHV